MITKKPAALAAEELIAEGVPFVEATVVRAQSPTSVRAGDAAIVRADGSIEGFVGGTCAETSVRLEALRLLETGQPLLLRILPGEVEEKNADQQGAITVQNPCLSGGALEIFLEPRLPPATMRVVGETPIARSLADLARRLGFAVELSAPQEAAPDPADAAVVVASHGHEEERVVGAALSQGVPYVGLVASSIRGESIRDSLELPEEMRARLHTPAGLEIGARSPEEIAVAILAEVIALQAAGDAPERGAAPAPDPPSTEVAIDPICGMEVAVSDASIQVERDGRRYYFCREGCRDTFIAQGAEATDAPLN